MKKLVSPQWDLEYSYKNTSNAAGRGYRYNGRISIMCGTIEAALAAAREHIEAQENVSELYFHVARKRSSNESVFVVEDGE